VVVLARDVDGEKTLVAYFIARDGMSPTVSELRSHLREQLPEYMVPAAYVKLDNFPMTHSSKVDHAALPEPARARPETGKPYEMPRTNLEHQIANIWQDVLHLEKVGVQDNFFDLGGDSVRMIQIHSRLQSVVADGISMMDLFHHPTISSLALRLVQPQKQKLSTAQTHQRSGSRKELAEQRQLRKQSHAENL